MNIRPLVPVATALLALAALAPAQTTHTVEVGPGGASTYSPRNLSVTVGDTVHWVWRSSYHNVRADSGAFYSGAPENYGATFDVVFDQALLDSFPVSGNKYSYYCEPHQFLGMSGDVTVLTPGRPVLSVNSLFAGGTANIMLTGLGAGNTVLIGWSLAGGGPMSTPYGNALLTPPYSQLPAQTASGTGTLMVQATVPAGMSGVPVWLQALDLGASVLSNGVAAVIG